MKSKTIILSSASGSGRGILTLYEEDELLKCKIRLYNINKLNRFCKLGVYHNKEVFSANLLEKDGVYHSSMVGTFDLDGDFYVAIVNTEENNNVILSGGTYAGFFFNDESVFEKKFERIEKENPNTNLFNYEEEIINETNIEPKCDEEFDCDKCKNCKYKEFFYSQTNEQNKVENPMISFDDAQDDNTYSPVQTIASGANLDQGSPHSIPIQKQSPEIIEINENKQENKDILSALIPQFKYVFENYPEDNVLTQLIPNGKFVMIDENDSHYSIGAIYENEEMKYICYAVMCDYNTPVPNEIGEHYQWLPLDKEDPMSEGYYIVFQDANDLKIVEL